MQIVFNSLTQSCGTGEKQYISAVEAQVWPENIPDQIILAFLKENPQMLKIKFPELILAKGAWYYK